MSVYSNQETQRQIFKICKPTSQHYHRSYPINIWEGLLYQMMAHFYHCNMKKKIKKNVMGRVVLCFQLVKQSCRSDVNLRGTHILGPDIQCLWLGIASQQLTEYPIQTKCKMKPQAPSCSLFNDKYCKQNCQSHLHLTRRERISNFCTQKVLFIQDFQVAKKPAPIVNTIKITNFQFFFFFSLKIDYLFKIKQNQIYFYLKGFSYNQTYCNKVFQNNLSS